MKGMYIHIPFCHQICHYCDFNKVFFHAQPVDEYVEALGQELAIMKEEAISFQQLETVFIGGGTPTSLSVAQLQRLMEIIHQFVDVSALKEFTIEANPDELTIEKLHILKTYGVDRLSLGVQSFDNDLLKAIGRTHGKEDVYRVVADARKVGFTNISIDLIYALPNQTMAQWQATLDEALALNLPHYSAYSLIIEPKTVFYNLMNKGKLPLPGEDAETEMFDYLIRFMKQNGREQYEVSNFSLPTFQSVHNLLYWENVEYAGVGAGAHGYLNGIRYSNIGPIKPYMEKTQKGERPVLQMHEVTRKESMEEEMFLGLRKTTGVSMEIFANKFGETIHHIYGEEITRLIESELVIQEDGFIRLTEKGLFRGNDVFQQFLT